MWRALVIEGHRETSLRTTMQSAHHGGPSGWKKQLEELIGFPVREEVERFIREQAYGAMQSVGQELRNKGWSAEVHFDEAHQRAYIEIVRDNEIDFIYEIRLRGYAKPSFAYSQMAGQASQAEEYFRAEVFLRSGGMEYDVYGFCTEEIIEDILAQFAKYLHFLHISPGVLPWKVTEHDEMIDTDADPNIAPPPQNT